MTTKLPLEKIVAPTLIYREGIDCIGEWDEAVRLGELKTAEELASGTGFEGGLKHHKRGYFPSHLVGSVYDCEGKPLYQNPNVPAKGPIIASPGMQVAFTEDVTLTILRNSLILHETKDPIGEKGLIGQDYVVAVYNNLGENVWMNQP